MNLFWETFEYPCLRFWWPCTYQEIIKKGEIPRIDNYLRHLMRVRDACFIKYYRTKKATEKLKILAEDKIWRNEVKMKTKQTKKIISKIYSNIIKHIYQIFGKLFALVSSISEEKVNLLHAP